MPSERQGVPSSADPNSAVVNVADWSMGDGSADVDLIGFQSHVEALSSFITNLQTRPPLTVSVEGSWGVGKTSIMIQVMRKIAHSPAARIPRWKFWQFVAPRNHAVWFNAWRHDKRDSLWAAFALTVARALRAQVAPLQRIRGDAARFAKRIRGVRAALKLVVASTFWLTLTIAIGLLIVATAKAGTAPMTGTGGKVLPIQELLPVLISRGTNGWRVANWAAVVCFSFASFCMWWAKTISNPLEVDIEKYLTKPNYEDRLAFIEDFHNDFVKLLNAYVGNRRVFVFVDDLDRCEDTRIADLFQAVNLLIGEDARMVFIIGMDREAIGRALGTEDKAKAIRVEGESLQSADGSGRNSYLEKFVQLTVRVPIASDECTKRLLVFDAASAPGEIPANANASRIVGRAAKGERSLKLGADSPMLVHTVSILSRHLDSNPRRTKRFINLLRYNAYLAANQGRLAGDPPCTVDQGKFSIEQLGKISIIALKWPSLLDRLIADPELLGKLATVAEAGLDRSEDPGLHGWQHDSGLMTLLREGTDVAELGPRLSLRRCSIVPLFYASTRGPGRLKRCVIFKSADSDVVLGHGETEEEAWRDAAARLGSWDQGDIRRVGLESDIDFVEKP